MALIFQLCFFLTGPFWLLMLLLPTWSGTRRIIGSLWIVVPVGLLYVGLILALWRTLLPLFTGPTLAGITGLLGSEAGATAAWVHLLAFDLFVGRWVYLDGYQRGLPRWAMTPLLNFVVMVGPAGLLLYLGVRTVFGKWYWVIKKS
jgi:hypothetical protein